jgi:hypothetical protein
MKCVYRGFEIEAKRENCMAGYPLLYYTIVRQSDGWIMVDNFTYGSDAVRDFIKHLKSNVDDYCLNPQDWDDPALEEAQSDD